MTPAMDMFTCSLRPAKDWKFKDSAVQRRKDLLLLQRWKDEQDGVRSFKKSSRFATIFRMSLYRPLQSFTACFPKNHSAGGGGAGEALDLCPEHDWTGSVGRLCSDAVTKIRTTEKSQNVTRKSCHLESWNPADAVACKLKAESFSSSSSCCSCSIPYCSNACKSKQEQIFGDVRPLKKYSLEKFVHSAVVPSNMAIWCRRKAKTMDSRTAWQTS